MDTVVIGSVVFLLVAVAVLAAGQVFTRRASGAQQRAARRLRGDDAATGEPNEGLAGRVRAIVLRIGGWANNGKGNRVAYLRSRLALAGFRQTSAVSYFIGARVVSAVLLMAVTGGVVAAQLGWSHAVLWGVSAGSVGYLLPAFVLSSLVSKRQRVLRNALPDAVDIMVLSTEGGVSLQAALDLIAEEIPPVHPVLGAELRAAQREMHFGLSPGEAIRELADRCGLPEARDLAAAIQQGEKYGSSVAKTLRTYSDTARQERQIWAEEMAQKAAVKILFPMLLCIFPAIFMVLLGPAAFQMSKLFAH